MADERENLEGLELVEGVPNPLTHEGGRPRVIGIPEETRIDPYTGDLTHQGFEYIRSLFKNRPEARQPLPCEAPGTRHRGNAVSLMKIPGRDLHMPVCARHRELYLKEAIDNPPTGQPTQRSTYSGGREYVHRPITPEDHMEYRIARAIDKKLGEFRDEEAAYKLFAEPWTARKKSTHGPGFPPGKPQVTQALNTLISTGKTEDEAKATLQYRLKRRKKYQGMFSHTEWQAMIAAGLKAPEEDVTEGLLNQVKNTGGKDRIHLAHHALLHASVHDPETGTMSVNQEAYFKKADELGLSMEEARQHIIPAMQRHKRIHKTTSFIPKPTTTTTRFGQYVSEEETRRIEEESLRIQGKQEVKTADTGEIEGLMKPDIPTIGETKRNRDTGTQAD